MSPSPDQSVIAVDRRESITVLTVRPDPSRAATFDALVSEPVVKAIEALKAEVSRDSSAPIALLQLDNDAAPARFAEALLEALRGVCGSLTLEAAGTRVNLIRAASRADADSTIRFLEQSAAGFVAGSTIDLTKEEVR